ncbi:MAG: hypothetical protein RRY29_10665 [Desulfovibrionaceae bacterium]
MPSKIAIWNMALGFIGTRTVASADENTPEAIQCKLFWDNARRQALRDYPWNFAQRRAWLAAIPVPEGWELEYTHAYTLPEDCLKALRVLEGGRSEQRFVLAHDVHRGATVLLSHAAAALLCYTADLQRADEFDDLFQSLMARKLASLVCVPLLKNNSGKVKELEQLYAVALAAALSANGSEGAEEEKKDSWLESRN